jgi:predicted unusual protein kinase regulating ubiquinone biosynthesis (AarF/ABC1/UbiB family)
MTRLYLTAGQFISTASGMPAPFQRHLSKLQDSVKPLEWEDVRGVIAAELGMGVISNKHSTDTDSKRRIYASG